MYEGFYKLKEKPFSLLPDPDYLYLSNKHQMALTLLEYSLLNQAGFCVTSGETGAGKTTLIRRLLNQCDKNITVGLISNTHESLGDLLRWVLMAFGLDHVGKTKLEMYQIFVNFLIDQYAKNRHSVLIVDEAQNLSLERLEELRMLSNLNADKDQVLQIMLIGQPRLRENLRRPELEQFAQRVAVDYHLNPLDQEETCAYIHHRISVAEGDPALFSDEACREVFCFTGGTPRLINLLCDTTLVYGYAEQQPVIYTQTVRDVIRDREAHGILPTFQLTDIKDYKKSKGKNINVNTVVETDSNTTGLQNSSAPASGPEKKEIGNTADRPLPPPLRRQNLSINTKIKSGKPLNNADTTVHKTRSRSGSEAPIKLPPVNSENTDTGEGSNSDMAVAQKLPDESQKAVPASSGKKHKISAHTGRAKHEADASAKVITPPAKEPPAVQPIAAGLEHVINGDELSKKIDLDPSRQDAYPVMSQARKKKSIDDIQKDLVTMQRFWAKKNRWWLTTTMSVAIVGVLISISLGAYILFQGSQGGVVSASQREVISTPIVSPKSVEAFTNIKPEITATEQQSPKMVNMNVVPVAASVAAPSISNREDNAVEAEVKTLARKRYVVPPTVKKPTKLRQQATKQKRIGASSVKRREMPVSTRAKLQISPTKLPPELKPATKTTGGVPVIGNVFWGDDASEELFHEKLGPDNDIAAPLSKIPDSVPLARDVFWESDDG